MAHQTKQAPPIKETSPETPDELVAIVDRLMQKGPEARYASIAEAVEALKPLVSESPAPGSRYAPKAEVHVPANGMPAASVEAPRPAAPPPRPAVAPVTRAAAAPPSPAPAPPPPMPSRPSIPSGPPVLPTRERLLNPGGAPAAAADSLPNMPKKYAVENLPEPPKSLEERLGTTGMVVMAVFLAVVAYLLFMIFFK
jgi:hypothetical protein